MNFGDVIFVFVIVACAFPKFQATAITQAWFSLPKWKFSDYDFWCLDYEYCCVYVMCRSGLCIEHARRVVSELECWLKN